MVLLTCLWNGQMKDRNGKGIKVQQGAGFHDVDHTQSPGGDRKLWLFYVFSRLKDILFNMRLFWDYFMFIWLWPLGIKYQCCIQLLCCIHVVYMICCITCCIHDVLYNMCCIHDVLYTFKKIDILYNSVLYTSGKKSMCWIICVVFILQKIVLSW